MHSLIYTSFATANSNNKFNKKMLLKLSNSDSVTRPPTINLLALTTGGILKTMPTQLTYMVYYYEYIYRLSIIAYNIASLKNILILTLFSIRVSLAMSILFYL